MEQLAVSKKVTHSKGFNTALHRNAEDLEGLQSDDKVGCSATTGSNCAHIRRAGLRARHAAEPLPPGMYKNGGDEHLALMA
jgi:hypothetical protein